MLAVGAATLALDFVVVYGVALASPSYSHTAQYMSELAVPGEPYAALLSAWWVLYGLLLVGFAVGLRGAFGRVEIAAGAMPFLVALTGAGLGVGGGLYPCDAGCAGITPSGKAHTLAGVVGSLALVAAPLALGFATRRHPVARALSLQAWAFGAAGLAIFALSLASGAPDSALAPYRGLWQRVFLAFYYAWLTLLATQLVRGETLDLH